MALGRTVTKREDIPHEPGEWVEFRALGFVALQKARDARSASAVKSIRDMGPEMYAFIASSRGPEAGPEAPQEDGLVIRSATAAYDQLTLLQLGIAGWSYNAKVSPDTVADLDQTTAEWAAERIVEISVPSGGDDRKNS